METRAVLMKEEYSEETNVARCSRKRKYLMLKKIIQEKTHTRMMFKISEG